MKGLKVFELYLACKKQVEKGNADKTICISTDEEGNEFHMLFYTFTENVKEFTDAGIYVEMDSDDKNPENYIILG